MLISILGSGDSLDLFRGEGDIVISSHYSRHEKTTMIATCHADLYAWSHLPTITRIKEISATSPPALPEGLDWSWDGSSDIAEIKNVCVDGLKVFHPASLVINTGALSVLWCKYTHPNAEIHLWGFDGDAAILKGERGIYRRGALGREDQLLWCNYSDSLCSSLRQIYSHASVRFCGV